MEFLAGLYTLLLVTICLLLAAVLWKLNKPRNGGVFSKKYAMINVVLINNLFFISNISNFY